MMMMMMNHEVVCGGDREIFVHNLPQLAYAICNLCLYLFCNYKITNKVFLKFCLNFMGKEYEE